MAVANLRELRRKTGVALKALAKDLNVDPGFLSRIERGVVKAPNHIVRAYLERFGAEYKVLEQRNGSVAIRDGSAQYGAVQSRLPIDVPPPPSCDLRLMPKLARRVERENFPPEVYLSPNPHLADLVDHSAAPKLVPGPYSSNISAGKNTYVYDAHTYHTKVPPQGIGLLLEYYTRPGDVILDPFCGSGMTGVAATEKGRKAILCDLSPAAALIAYNMATPISATRYLQEVGKILSYSRELEHKLYDTHCRTCGRLAPMLYMVWSYGALCNNCGHEFVVWDVARDERASVRESKIRTEFGCPHCTSHLKKRELRRTRRYPVQVGYRCCQSRLKEATAPPDEYDLAKLQTLDGQGVPADLWYPTDLFPDGVNTRQPIAAGITTIDKAYTPRALWGLAYLWDVALRWPDPEVRSKLLFTLTSLYQRVTIFSEFRFWGGSSNTANFNVPAIMNEQNVFRAFERKADTISWYFSSAPQVHRALRVSTQSACDLTQLPDRCVDYIFTDPPFGANINYSEMNFLWESWLGVHTDNTEEIVVNKVQGKGVRQYAELLTQAFAEVRRVLKDAGWMTVVFHNSSAQVWEALQAAIADAGFAIEGTQTLDKRHGTFKQFVSDNAVGYDLVLHCRKSLGERAMQRNGKEFARRHAASFIQHALSQAPHEYVVRYLHVSRGDEFDYRRLYAEWLAVTLPDIVISLSFDEFRVLVDTVLRSVRIQKL